MTKVETTPAIIDGETVITDEIIEVRAPFDGNLVGSVPRCGKEHLDRAVKAAHRELKANALAPWERAAILDRVAELLVERRDAFAHLIASEAGKPITVAEGEAGRAVNTLTYAAIAARTLTGETVPMAGTEKGDGTIAWTERVPIGVIGAISPFNFPLNLVCHKVAPAIAAGCPVVLKPASSTPLTALLLASMLEDDAGLPPGWLNVVTVPGRVANALVTHDDVAAITFTGSPEVGWGIRADAPRKRVGLELGNNAPVIVHRDADVALAAKRITAGGYGYSGQTCISVQRVYVHQDVADEFLDAFQAQVSELVVGDPADDATNVSALIDSDETNRVAGAVTEAIAEGATAVIGGDDVSDGLLKPTVLTDVNVDMAVSRTEVFGPVVGVARYSDVNDAFAWANDTRYGLQAGIFTNDLSLGIEAAHRLDYGGVCVNEVPTYRTDQMPYGGVRDSGNTKEGPAWAVREMTEERMVVIAR